MKILNAKDFGGAVWIRHQEVEKYYKKKDCDALDNQFREGYLQALEWVLEKVDEKAKQPKEVLLKEGK